MVTHAMRYWTACYGQILWKRSREFQVSDTRTKSLCVATWNMIGEYVWAEQLDTCRVIRAGRERSIPKIHVVMLMCHVDA